MICMKQTVIVEPEIFSPYDSIVLYYRSRLKIISYYIPGALVLLEHFMNDSRPNTETAGAHISDLLFSSA